MRLSGIFIARYFYPYWILMRLQYYFSYVDFIVPPISFETTIQESKRMITWEPAAACSPTCKQQCMWIIVRRDSFWGTQRRHNYPACIIRKKKKKKKNNSAAHMLQFRVSASAARRFGKPRRSLTLALSRRNKSCSQFTILFLGIARDWYAYRRRGERPICTLFTR